MLMWITSTMLKNLISVLLLVLDSSTKHSQVYECTFFYSLLLVAMPIVVVVIVVVSGGVFLVI